MVALDHTCHLPVCVELAVFIWTHLANRMYTRSSVLFEVQTFYIKEDTVLKIDTFFYISSFFLISASNANPVGIQESQENGLVQLLMQYS